MGNCESTHASEASRPEAAGVPEVSAEAAEGRGTFFYFVDAKKILELGTQHLPRFQELRAKEGWIKKIHISLSGACRGSYTNILAVSHRWELPDTPDSRGVQLAALQEHLRQHPEIQLVWIDWSSMPQGNRTTTEQAEFKQMLMNINLIYLGCKVLLIVDLSYVSRFWTLFEAWLSMRTATTAGLARTLPDKRRCTMVCVHKAEMRFQAAHLEEMWAERTAEEAYDILSSPDVTITNQSDKDMQLPKLLKFDKLVLDAVLQDGVAFSVGPRPRDRAWREEYVAAMLERMGVEEGATLAQRERKMYEPGGGASLEVKITNLSSAIQRQVDLGWPREDAEAYTVIALYLGPVANAVRERSDRFAASTHAISDALARRVSALEDLAPPVYFNLTGNYGLAWGDPAWGALQRPGAAAIGCSFVTNTVAKGILPNSRSFPDERGFCVSLNLNGKSFFELQDSDVVCFRSEPGAADALRRSLVQVGFVAYALPPMAVVTLERVEEPGTWEANGKRIRRRLYTVTVAYRSGES